jgi:hypothetical protein
MRTQRTRLHGRSGKMKQWRRERTGRPRRGPNLPSSILDEPAPPKPSLALPVLRRKVVEGV